MRASNGGAFIPIHSTCVLEFSLSKMIYSVTSISRIQRVIIGESNFKSVDKYKALFRNQSISGLDRCNKCLDSMFNRKVTKKIVDQETKDLSRQQPRLKLPAKAWVIRFEISCGI